MYAIPRENSVLHKLRQASYGKKGEDSQPLNEVQIISSAIVFILAGQYCSIALNDLFLWGLPRISQKQQGKPAGEERRDNGHELMSVRHEVKCHSEGKEGLLISDITMSLKARLLLYIWYFTTKQLNLSHTREATQGHL